MNKADYFIILGMDKNDILKTASALGEIHMSKVERNWKELRDFG
jgi:hypothetical protein